MVNGDPGQIDLPRRTISGIKEALLVLTKKLQPSEYLSFTFPGSANTSRLYEFAILAVIATIIIRRYIMVGESPDTTSFRTTPTFLQNQLRLNLLVQ